MTKKLNRREFLSRTLAGAGAAALAGCTEKPASGPAPAASVPTAPAVATAGTPLLTRTLGRTGLVLPVVAMGVMNADNPELVRRAFELGLRHFDTAAGYWRGKNEEMVARVLDEMGVRSQAVVATKANVPPAQRASLEPAALKEAFLRIFEGSLKRLRSDRVDILYIHDVSLVEDLTRKGFLDALTELKERKKIGFAGFSTHTNMAACLEEATRTGFFDVVLVAYNYAMQDDLRLKRAIDAAAAKGIGLVAMKTQCMQDWYREGLPAGQQALYSGSIVQSAVSSGPSRTRPSPAPSPASPRSPSSRRTSRSPATWPSPRRRRSSWPTAASGWPWPAASSAGSVCGTCPAGVDTRTLMRAHMYLGYPNVFQARDTLAGIPAGRGLDGCVSCAACVARCRGRIDIARRVDQLRTHLG